MFWRSEICWPRLVVMQGRIRLSVWCLHNDQTMAAWENMQRHDHQPTLHSCFLSGILLYTVLYSSLFKVGVKGGYCRRSGVLSAFVFMNLICRILQIDELFEYVEEDVEEDPANEAEFNPGKDFNQFPCMDHMSQCVAITLGQPLCMWNFEICEALMQFEGGGLAKAKSETSRQWGAKWGWQWVTCKVAFDLWVQQHREYRVLQKTEQTKKKKPKSRKKTK